MTADRSTLPLVAIVGRPNVGKSTLFNRIVGGRPALVEDEPGVTRDRRYAEADYAGRHFRIVDTGGLLPGAAEGAITHGIHRQAYLAIDEAEVIVLVVDAREGLTPVDRDVAQLLRRSRRPVLVAANKVDAAKQEALAAEAHELGLGDVFAVSATHGRGAVELLDAILAALPPVEEAAAATAGEAGPEAEAAPGVVRLAFVGRPNVGKSSLVNRLLGEERVLVHDLPGTTTDPVDTPFEYRGDRYVLVDTAGIRRKARIEAPTEKISVSMALEQIARADVVALVIDATEGPAEQDARIAGEAAEAGRAIFIVLNKADLLGDERQAAAQVARLKERVADDLRFVAFAPVQVVSARTGQGVTAMLDAAAACYRQHGKRVATGELNRFFAEVTATRPPPTLRGKPVRIHYLTQPAIHPPTFVLWANRPELVHYGYRRFLVNQLRERFGFEGTPLRVVTRRKSGSKSGGKSGGKPR